MAAPELLASLELQLGVTRHTNPIRNERCNQTYTVRVVGKRAAALCRRISPYVRHKQAQLQVAREFASTIGKGMHQHQPITPELQQKRRLLKERLTFLNRRGPR